jgi:hypothetical protein
MPRRFRLVATERAGRTRATTRCEARSSVCSARCQHHRGLQFGGSSARGPSENSSGLFGSLRRTRFVSRQYVHTSAYQTSRRQSSMSKARGRCRLRSRPAAVARRASARTVLAVGFVVPATVGARRDLSLVSAAAAYTS